MGHGKEKSRMSPELPPEALEGQQSSRGAGPRSGQQRWGIPSSEMRSLGCERRVHFTVQTKRKRSEPDT